MADVKKWIYGDEDPLLFKVNLEKTGRTWDDVADIFFSIKEDFKDDDDALVFKSLQAAEIIREENNVSVKLLPADYEKLTVGKKYQLILFVKHTGQTYANEKANTFEWMLTEDKLRS